MELLERYFDNAFDAPDGIKRLRELILSLAMQGKLVPQEAEDMPASQVIKEIEIEKRRLFQQGKLKEPKVFSSVEPEEAPYTLPRGWEWVRLGTFLEMVNGRAFKPTEWKNAGLPIVRIQNLNNPNASFNYCDDSDVKEQHIIHPQDFLISWSGTPGTSFGAFVWSGGKAALNQHIFRCSQIGKPFLDEFLRRAINNRLNFLISLAQGAVGLKHVTKGTLEDMPLPLPPREEQSRIIAKIGELMTRCDALQKLRADRDSKRLAVHSSAVQELLNFADMDGHIRARELLGQHFGELYTVNENVTELRKAILQLAVTGKLVPQHPNDAPASELLKQIDAEKKRLITAGKLREPKPLPQITSEETPYILPAKWQLTRLDYLLTYGPTNGISPQAVEYETGVRSLTLSATTSGTFKGEFLKYVDIEVSADSDLWLQDGDILVQRGNTFEYVGVPAIYKGGPHTYIYPDLMMKIRVSKYVDVDYVYHAMRSGVSRDYLRSRATGTSGTMPKISQGTLRSLPVPLPPFAEQRRIVTKIDQLMSMCDALEQRIDAARETQSAMLDAMMAQYGVQ